MRTFSHLIGCILLMVLAACSQTTNTSNVSSEKTPASQVAQTGGKMSFFITSANPGSGGNLGGLAGADAYCQTLATSVGA